MTEHTRTKFFWRDIQKVFFKMFTWVLLDGFLNGFWVIFEKYSMHILSKSGNDFIAHWAYEETISSHTEHTPNEFSGMFSQRKNDNSFYMYRNAEHMGKWFYHTLSIQEYDFNAGWAYEEMISSLTEHTGKCLKVEYLGHIGYDFQKSCVTGPWDPKDSVSAKKVINKFSCLCTFKVSKKGQYEHSIILYTVHSIYVQYQKTQNLVLI